MDELDLRHRFLPAPLPDERNGKLGVIRQALYDVARLINSTIGDGREKALAITSLETAADWVRNAIERGNGT